MILLVEYAERRIKHGIPFIFSLVYEYINLEYVRIHGIYEVDQAAYVNYIREAVSQEYVNTYSIRRVVVLLFVWGQRLLPLLVCGGAGVWRLVGAADAGIWSWTLGLGACFFRIRMEI